MNPGPQLRYLGKMTTKLGLIQHSLGDRPDLRFGYSIDDNARAVLALLAVARVYHSSGFTKKVKPYFDLIQRAQVRDGRFINFFDKNGKPLEQFGSQDSFARTIWALSALSVNEFDGKLATQAKTMLKKSFPYLAKLKFPRSWAFALLGATTRKDKKSTRFLSKKLINLYSKNATRNWQWFEPRITYANAALPWALSEASILLKDKFYLRVAKESFDFLDKIYNIKDLPWPVGSNGWYEKNQKRALFDQQPIEAADMVLCAASLFKATNDKKYAKIAHDWLSWFYGNNSLKMVMLNQHSGGIYDGITENGLNKNQGGENIVLFLLALCAIKSLINDSKINSASK